MLITPRLRAVRVTIALPAAPISKLSHPRHAVPSPLAILILAHQLAFFVHVRILGTALGCNAFICQHCSSQMTMNGLSPLTSGCLLQGSLNGWYLNGARHVEEATGRLLPTDHKQLLVHDARAVIPHVTCCTAYI